jgi:hypothetical protein
MNCPNCGGEMFDLMSGFLQCSGTPPCGLAGPREALEALARKLTEPPPMLKFWRSLAGARRLEAERLKSPEFVLAAADQLLKERGVIEVTLSRYAHDFTAVSFGEAYEKLKEGT